MNNRNPSSPWNPNSSVEVTPKEYELQVVEWLKNTGLDLTDFSLNHLVLLSGQGGEYEFDAVSEFSIFNGAKIKVLIECKRYNRPVEREIILSIYSKLCDVGANKAMIFSTSGFQKGALEYAASRGIATITFIDGKSNYHTRLKNHEIIELPSWIEFPKFSGWFIKYDDNSIRSSLIENKRLESLVEWMKKADNIA